MPAWSLKGFLKMPSRPNNLPYHEILDTNEKIKKIEYKDMGKIQKPVK